MPIARMTEQGLNVEITDYGAYDVLALSWPGHAIQHVVYEDEYRELPAAGSKLAGATSYWKFRHNAQADIYVSALDANGVPEDRVIAMRPYGQTAIEAYAHIALHDTPAHRNVNDWGVQVQPIVSLVSTRDESHNPVLPVAIYQVDLIVHRRGQPMISRPLYVMDSFIINVIRRLHEASDDVREQWRKRMDSDAIPEADLLDALYNEDTSLSHLTPDGCRIILQLLEKVRIEGGKAIQAIRIGRSELQENVALRFWNDAAAFMVAQELAYTDLAVAGLTPFTDILRLNTLMLAEGDMLSLANLPETLVLDVRLSDDTLCAADKARAEIVNGKLVWSRREVALADNQMQKYLKTIGQSWDSLVFEMIERDGISVGDNFYLDIEKLSAVDDCPQWLADAVSLKEGAFDDYARNTGLLDRDYWTRADLPLILRRRVLSYMAHIQMGDDQTLASGDMPFILTFEEGQPFFSGLMALHERLSDDPDYMIKLDDMREDLYVDCDADSPHANLALLLFGIDHKLDDTRSFLNVLEYDAPEAVYKLARRVLGMVEIDVP